MQLTPAPSWEATEENYCYWDGSEVRQPHGIPGHVFATVEDFASRIYDDYGWATSLTTGEPTGDWMWPADTPTPYAGVGGRIGGPGFNWLKLNTPTADFRWCRFPHIGGVIFGDKVTIDDYVTIDRAGVGNTIIGDNVHIDSHVHIGHNARIGRSTIITAGAIIGGGAIIGDNVFIGLGAVIRNKVQVGNLAVIGMGAIVLTDVPAGETWIGNPARELP